MGNCIFIASDTPLPEVTPSQDYLLRTYHMDFLRLADYTNHQFFCDLIGAGVILES